MNRVHKCFNKPKKLKKIRYQDIVWFVLSVHSGTITAQLHRKRQHCVWWTFCHQSSLFAHWLFSMHKETFHPAPCGACVTAGCRDADSDATQPSFGASGFHGPTNIECEQFTQQSQCVSYPLLCLSAELRMMAEGRFASLPRSLNTQHALGGGPARPGEPRGPLGVSGASPMTSRRLQASLTSSMELISSSRNGYALLSSVFIAALQNELYLLLFFIVS